MAAPGRNDDETAATILLAACTKERSLRVLDLATGTTYFTFWDSAAATIACVGGPGAAEGLNSAGDYVVSSQVNEQALVFHRWGKTQPLFKCRTPETVGPVVTTPDGLYVLAGGRSGKVYVWEVASGSLLQSWDAHFKAVTHIVMTSDGSFVITGSQDTMVRVWALADVLVASGTEAGGGTPTGIVGGVGDTCIYAARGSKGCSLQPFRSWSQHSLPVTGLYCGQGGPTCRIVSCSLDHMAYIYELSSEAGAVCALRAPTGLACVALDAGEKRLLLGSTLGEVFIVDMDVVSQARTANRALVHVVSGAPASRRQARSGRQESERWDTLAGHTKGVTALACSWDGRMLVSASEDGSLRWWDLDNQQCVKKVVFDTPGPIAHVLLLPRPTALLDMLPKTVLPAPLQPFKKYRTGANVGVSNGDTVFVPGKKGEKRRVDTAAPSMLFFWGKQETRLSSSKRDVETVVEEEVVEEGETKKRRIPTPPTAATPTLAVTKGKKGGKGAQRKK